MYVFTGKEKVRAEEGKRHKEIIDVDDDMTRFGVRERIRASVRLRVNCNPSWHKMHQYQPVFENLPNLHQRMLDMQKFGCWWDL